MIKKKSDTLIMTFWFLEYFNNASLSLSQQEYMYLTITIHDLLVLNTCITTQYTNKTQINEMYCLLYCRQNALEPKYLARLREQCGLLKRKDLFFSNGNAAEQVLKVVKCIRA